MIKDNIDIETVSRVATLSPRLLLLLNSRKNIFYVMVDCEVFASIRSCVG